jgi:phosphatidylglycerol:prolipoprotein diacylglycerol transferase
MCPELFKIPFVGLSVKSYGLMMVVGFLAAIVIIRRLSRDIMPNPEVVTNAALYALIAGVIGARVFYVVHYLDRFKTQWLSIFAIWQGGLELLGGVILAIVAISFYLRRYRLPFRVYADILAIGLMVALAFGRVGCFLNGCCYGRPSDVPWAVRFPYGSLPYLSQVRPDPDRNRLSPYLKLPAGFFGYLDTNGEWQPDYGGSLKPLRLLTESEKREVATGSLRCLPVHPTQLYSSANAGGLAVVLYFIWRRGKRLTAAGRTRRFLARPGSTFAVLLVLYGLTRFFIEFLRDDNPLGWWGLTISQRLCLVLIAAGAGLVGIFARLEPPRLPANRAK